MSSYQKSMQTGPRIRAGVLAKPIAQINIRPSVTLPNAYINPSDSRKVFESSREFSLVSKQKANITVEASFAALLIMSMLLILSMTMLRSDGEIQKLKERMINVHSRYLQVEKEISERQICLEKACDSSYICYKASRELGMKRAVGGSVIKITAPETRPSTGNDVFTIASSSYNHD